jgi:hypothetical protein
MTKEDYMQLSKERLAELLVERDMEDRLKSTHYIPSINIPCYAPDGICVNPQRDCINCPKVWNSGQWVTTTTINTSK